MTLWLTTDHLEHRCSDASLLLESNRRAKGTLRATNAAVERYKCMGQLDQTIEWVRRQLSSSERALDDIRKGRKIEVNGVDVTEQWIVMYERLIRRLRRLLEFYQKRNQSKE